MKYKGRRRDGGDAQSDKEVVRAVQEGLKKTGGAAVRADSNGRRTTEYMCEEFREQIDDPDFEGFYCCMLYYKSRRKKG